MKTIKIFALSLVLLLSLINLNLFAAQQEDLYPNLSEQYPSSTAYRSTGSIPIPDQTRPLFTAGSYPPPYQGSEGRTPPSGYFSDLGSPRTPFPPSPVTTQRDSSPSYAYQAGPQWAQPAPTSSLSEPARETRQRSKTFSFGTLSLETDTDSTTEKSSLPRQLHDPITMFSTEKDQLVTAAQNFLKRAQQEATATIDEFTIIINAGDSSPGEKRRDSPLGKITKALRSPEKQARSELTERHKELEKKKGPYEERLLSLAAQCSVMKRALEGATKKLTILESMQPK